MISATDLKNGTTFLLDGKPYQVLKFSHSKVARGGATVKTTVRNLETGDSLEKTFNGQYKFDEINTQKRELQYLYNDGTDATFMSPRTFEQSEVPVDVLADSLLYIKEGENVNVLFWEERALAVEIPPKVVLKIEDTAPGVKGNTTANSFKPAKLENGLEVKVPLFIKNGDSVKVDTRTGEYVERAS